MYTSTHTYIYIYICMCMCIYIYICICMYILTKQFEVRGFAPREVLVQHFDHVLDKLEAHEPGPFSRTDVSEPMSPASSTRTEDRCDG